MPAFCFPAEAGPHLPTPEGWKAELAGGWLHTEINVRRNVRTPAYRRVVRGNLHHRPTV